MKLDEIMASIDRDSNIDQNNLDRAALEIPMLHAKYYRIFMEEFRILKGLDSEYKKQIKLRSHYYLGKSEDQVYKDEPLDFKVLKVDLQMYTDADHVLVDYRNKMELQKAKVELLEGFIKTLNNRNFLIKAAIDWRRFQAGS